MLEHMKKRWEVALGCGGFWRVQTAEGAPWNLALIHGGLPGDESGELTARAIVDAHNASIDAEESVMPVNQIAALRANVAKLEEIIRAGKAGDAVFRRVSKGADNGN